MPDPLDNPEVSLKSQVAQNKSRDQFGHFVKKVKDLPHPPLVSNADTPSTDPALVSVKVTNPITYFKIWWKKVIGNEGMDFRIHVKPLTAIAIVFIIASGSFGVGLMVKLASNTPVVKYVPAFAASPTPNPWKETAFSGVLKQVGGTFYLVTTDAEAITLSTSQEMNLNAFLGKRIFVKGNYNTESGILVVSEVSDWEVMDGSE